MKKPITLKDLEEARRLYQETHDLLIASRAKRPAFEAYVYHLATKEVPVTSIAEAIGVDPSYIRQIVVKIGALQADK